MSNKKISQFQVVTTLNGTTYVPVIQGSPLFDAIISASNFAASMQDYNDNYYIKVDGTNSDIDYLNFNPDAVGNPQPYVRKWDASEGTFVFGLPDGGIIQEGKELFDYYVNADTVPLVNGDVVSIVPISGNRKAIKRTDVTNAQSAKNVIGMVTVASIAVGATGRVTKFGEVHDLITNAYAEGIKLYVSEGLPGKWSNVEPSLASYIVEIGTVIVSHNNNGIIELNTVCYPRLTDLSGVNGVGSTVNEPIVRNAAGEITAIKTGVVIDEIVASEGQLSVVGNLVVQDDLYSNNLITQNADIAGDLTANNIFSATGFNKTGSSNNQVLLGAGGAKNVADFQLKSEKGQANGYASLDANGLVPSAQLPSFVDDIIDCYGTYTNVADPETVIELYKDSGHTTIVDKYSGKIYLDVVTRFQFRWSGTAWSDIKSGPVQSVAGKTGIVTLVKADVGLSNVDNTSDANKPISTATQTALNGKVNNTGDETIAGVKTFSSSPIVPNPTTSGQAMNKGTADGTYVALTGNQTVAGVKTFSSSPIVPTPTNGTDAANKDYVTTSVIGAMPAATAKLAPELAYYTRVLADSGVIKDLEELTKLYLNDLELDKSTLFKWSGWSGVKTRTSGSNVYVTKAYDNSANNNDAVQATDANQPFYTGNIAPNEVGKLKIDDKTIRRVSFTNIAFTNAQPYSFTIVYNKSNSSSLYGPILGNYSGRGIDVAGSIQWRSYPSGTFYNLASTSLNQVGKNIVLTVVAINSTTFATYINGAYIGQTTVDSTEATFNSFMNGYGATLANQFNGTSSHLQIFNKALSAYEVQQHHTYLRSIYPEIEGVAIGNQFIATSNYEGVVAGDGSVINEVQPSNNTEKVVNGGFDADTTGWTNTDCTASVTGGVVTITNTSTTSGGISQTISTNALGKWFKLNVDYIGGTTQLIVQAGAGVNSGESYQAIDVADLTNVYFKALSNTLVVSVRARNTIAGAGQTAQVNLVSVEEVGWSQAQALYDGVYAQTTGTAAVKDLAATKAASMWCYYNNDALNGAIYGKLYNWWAVKLISLYPPKGWRVPSSADFTQLVNYNGGLTISGGKFKQAGLTYWTTPNTGATNESGFTLLPSGQRQSDGVFGNINLQSRYWSSDAYRFIVEYNSIITYLADYSANKGYGFAIRLLRNEPVGQAEKMEITGLFTTDIAATAKQLPISFGYVVDTLRIKSENALTAVEVKLHDSAGTAIATLITGKSISAGATMVYRINAEHVAMLQDGTIRMTASGNSGSTVGIELQAVLIKTSY